MKVRKSIRSRIKITKTGKVLRRPMGIDHFRARNPHKLLRSKRGSLAVHKHDTKSILQELTI